MTRFTEPTIFAETVTLLKAPTFNAPSVNDDAVIAGSNISADKLECRTAVSYVQDGGTDVVTATKLIHVCRGAGTIKSVEVRPATAPTGGDKQFTVDVQRAADASGSFATMLASAVTVDSSSVNNTRQQASLITTPSVADGDCLEIIVTASGSTGSQGQGVIVTVNIDENGA